MISTHRWFSRLLVLLILSVVGSTSASAGPRLYITPNVSNLDFGTTTVGTPVDRVVYLQNIGTSDMFMYHISEPEGFTVVNPPSPYLAIRPNSYVAVKLRMDAEVAGHHNGFINYEYNDPLAYYGHGVSGDVEEDEPEPPATQLIVVQPNADAHIVQENPDNNVGSQPILRIRSANSGAGRHTFLRFNVPAISGTIQSAVLRIRPQTKTITAAQIYDVNIGWSENTITWNNWLNGGTTFSYLRDTGVLAGEQWHEIDVHELISSSGGTVNIGITTNSTTAGFRFYSRQSSFSPTLEITVQ